MRAVYKLMPMRTAGNQSKSHGFIPGADAPIRNPNPRTAKHACIPMHPLIIRNERR